mgnify:CR=1 FL=1
MRNYSGVNQNDIPPSSWRHFEHGLARVATRLGETPPQQVMVLRMDEATTPETLKLCTDLRKAGISVELYPNVDKLGKQFQYAEKRGVKVAAFLGQKEKDAGKVAVKAMATKTQVEVDAANVVAEVQKLV